VQEECPICGGDEIGCLYGDWYMGDDEPSADAVATA
jgi:hypothetical protein